MSFAVATAMMFFPPDVQVRAACLITPEKCACVYEYRVNSRVVGNPYLIALRQKSPSSARKASERAVFVQLRCMNFTSHPCSFLREIPLQR